MKAGKPKASRKLRNKQRASGRKKHKAREDRADSLGRAKAGNRLDTSKAGVKREERNESRNLETGE